MVKYNEEFPKLDAGGEVCHVSLGYTDGLLARFEAAGSTTGHAATSNFSARCHAG